MKKILFFCSALVISFSSTAQDWAEYMQKPNANLYQAQHMFHMYWQGKDSLEKGKGYKAFKRWEHFAAPRVYPSGNIGLLSQTAQNYQSFLDTYVAPQNNNNIGGKYNNNNLIASTTWTPMGPFGALAGSAGGQLLKAGRLCFITINPTNTLNLYVGAPAGGLWRSFDGGASWSTNTDNLSVNGVSDLAIDPTNTLVMYMAMGDGDGGDTRSTGVLKSLDGGNTWANTGLVFPVANNFLIRRLVINPSNTQILLAATNGGIYRTINGGTSWAVVQASGCYDLEFQPGNPNTVYAGGTTFRRSTDGGATWTMIAAGIPTTGVSRMAIAVSPADVNRVYVLAGRTSDQGMMGVYQSTNAGVSFNTISPGGGINLLGWNSNGLDLGGQAWYDLAIAASPLNANEVVTGGVNVWRTTNAGASWAIYGHWTGSGAPFTHADHHDLEYAANGTLFNANDGTIYRRSGALWTDLEQTMNISQIYKIGTSALTANKWITGHQDNGTSIWNGITYSASLGGDGMDCFIDRTNDNNLFGEYYNGAFRRSTNGGATWTGYTTGLSGSAPWVTAWKQDPQTANTLYAGYSNMFRSILGTGSWTMMTALPVGGTVNEFAVAPSNSLVIYVLKNAGIYKTINGGTSWTTVTGTVPVGSGSPQWIIISPTDPNKAWVMLSGYSAGNKVFTTTNGGATWTNYTANLPNIPANCGVYQVGSSDRIYVGMDVGVYYRDNTQLTWTLYNTGLPNTPLADMEISPADPTKLIAATYGRGVWKVDVIASLAPVTAFNYSGTPCTGSPVQFNDVSINGPTSWTWSAAPAGGVTINTPSTQNPTITFANPGTYTVSLATSNGNGPGTIATQTISITATPTVVISNSVQTMCSGSTVNINSSGATTYSWNTGATTSVISVSPPSTTTYTLIGNNGVCASAPKTATVNVTITPTVTVNNATVCSGTPAILTATGATTYSWNTGPVTNTISVTPSVTTVYTVTGTTGACTNVKTSTVTVGTTPTVIVSNSVQSICSGTTVNINASGAATYSWNTGPTTSVIAVSPSVTTVYTVTGSNGACSNVKTATVNVTTTPTVSVNSATICSGTPAILTATGAATYSWNTGPVTNTISVSPSVTTVYTVTGSNGSCTNVKTSTVSVGTTPTVIVSNSVQSICSGATVNINASGAATYSWNTGPTTSVIAVSPVVTTVYTVTGNNGPCSNVKTATINVTTSPTVNVNSASICSGTNVILTASGASTYSWNTGPVTNTISVSPTVTTIYTVTGTTGGCTNIKTSTVTVNVTPTVVISNSVQSICSGATATLNASGATSYLWNNGATTSVISVSPLVTTVYTLTGSNGGCMNVKTATINVTTSPTVNVNSLVTCAGTNVLLTATGATSYSWNVGPTTNTINVAPVVTTIYTVTGTTGPCNGISTSTVTVNPLPPVNATASETLICKDQSVTITATGALTYTWQPGNLNGASITDAPVVTTVYTVSGVDGNGCIGTQTLMVTVSLCNGIIKNGSEAIRFSVFPNPTTDNITIYYPSNQNAELSMEIFDAIGKQILRKAFVFNKNNSGYTINISDVAKGTYFLKLTAKNGDSETVKLIKE